MKTFRVILSRSLNSYMRSLVLFLSRFRILTLSKLKSNSCFFSFACDEGALRFFLVFARLVSVQSFLCWSIRFPSLWIVSPMYGVSYSLQGMSYTTPDTSAFFNGCFNFEQNCRNFSGGLGAVFTSVTKQHNILRKIN